MVRSLPFKTPKHQRLFGLNQLIKSTLIAIPTEQAPKDFVENHEKYADRLFVASIKRWPITSLHPFGTLVSNLGPIDSPETEIDSILRDNNFYVTNILMTIMTTLCLLMLTIYLRLNPSLRTRKEKNI